MTSAVVHSPRTPPSWLPRINLIAAGAAVAVSVTALVIAVDDDPAAPQAAAVAPPTDPVVTEVRCDLHAGTHRC